MSRIAKTIRRNKRRRLKIKFPDYELVPETTGKIINGVYIRNDKQAVIISFAWGGNLHFGPEDEIRKEKQINNPQRSREDGTQTLY